MWWCLFSFSEHMVKSDWIALSGVLMAILSVLLFFVQNSKKNDDNVGGYERNIILDRRVKPAIAFVLCCAIISLLFFIFDAITVAGKSIIAFTLVVLFVALIVWIFCLLIDRVKSKIAEWLTFDWALILAKKHQKGIWDEDYFEDTDKEPWYKRVLDKMKKRDE